MMKAAISKQNKVESLPALAGKPNAELIGLDSDAHILPDAVPRTVSVLPVCVPRDSPESNSEYDRTHSLYVTF
jgi:hypothetical protein